MWSWAAGDARQTEHWQVKILLSCKFKPKGSICLFPISLVTANKFFVWYQTDGGRHKSIVYHISLSLSFGQLKSTVFIPSLTFNQWIVWYWDIPLTEVQWCLGPDSEECWVVMSDDGRCETVQLILVRSWDVGTVWKSKYKDIKTSAFSRPTLTDNWEVQHVLGRPNREQIQTSQGELATGGGHQKDEWEGKGCNLGARVKLCRGLLCS